MGVEPETCEKAGSEECAKGQEGWAVMFLPRVRPVVMVWVMKRGVEFGRRVRDYIASRNMYGHYGAPLPLRFAGGLGLGFWAQNKVCYMYGPSTECDGGIRY